MALRIASLLGAGCLSQQLGQALAEEKEFFPLSGGIDDGVEVEVKFDAISDTASKIEFVDRERKAAFRFEIDKTAKTITRSSSAEFSNAVAETFGGFATEFESGAPTLKFTKRRHEIAVTIGGKRFPWYDYSNRERDGSAPLLTHMAVYSGLTNPEVTLRRPTCETKCNVNECLNAAGQSVCQGGDCFSVVMSSTPGVATSCSANKETSPGGNSHCCDGDDAPPPARSPLAKDGYAKLNMNAAYLQRVCTAFGGCDNLDATKTVDQFAGSTVQVMSEVGENGLSTVFVPRALDSKTPGTEHPLPDATKFNIPRFALYQSFGPQKLVVDIDSPDAIGLSEFDADYFNDVIIASSGSRVADLGIQKGWFVHLVAYDFKIIAGPAQGQYPRLSKLTERTHQFWRGNNRPNRTVWLSDQPIEVDPSKCTDLPMTDANGDTCAKYTEGGWCTIHGFSTPAGCTNWGAAEGCDLPRGNDEQSGLNDNARQAQVSCCTCGGGHYQPPEDWTEATGAAQLFFK